MNKLFPEHPVKCYKKYKNFFFCIIWKILFFKSEKCVKMCKKFKKYIKDFFFVRFLSNISFKAKCAQVRHVSTICFFFFCKYLKKLRSTNTYLINCITTMMNHLPFVPHIFWADNSIKTSQYSNRVKISTSIFSVPSLTRSDGRLFFSIMRSLNNTSRFDME